jgi:hypothetical protein
MSTKLADPRIRLGVRARDAITGFTGIVVQEIEWSNANIQFGVQPEALKESGERRDMDTFDQLCLIYEDEGRVELAQPIEESAIVIGDRVKDIATGFFGTAMHKITYLNGCVHFIVRGEDLDDRGKPASVNFPARELEVIGEVEEVKDTVATRTGGPSLSRDLL